MVCKNKNKQTCMNTAVIRLLIVTKLLIYIVYILWSNLKDGIHLPLLTVLHCLVTVLINIIIKLDKPYADKLSCDSARNYQR